MIDFYKLVLASIVAVAATLPALPASAQRVGDGPSSSFAIVAQPVAGDAEQVTRPNRAFLTFDARPLTAVTLSEALPTALTAQFGGKNDVPFDTRLPLYGWPERPGLYCDLLRPRGLGLSAACLRDTDGDGRFDEGLRLDFHSAISEIMVVSHSAKIIGARFRPRTTTALPHPVAYAPATIAATGRLALRWRPGRRESGGEPTAEIWISTPDNHTGTEGLSQNLVVFRRQSVPLDVELYGIRLRIIGFDEDGGMRYRLLGMTDGTAVPLLFGGYRFTIIFIP